MDLDPDTISRTTRGAGYSKFPLDADTPMASRTRFGSPRLKYVFLDEEMVANSVVYPEEKLEGLGHQMLCFMLYVRSDRPPQQEDLLGDSCFKKGAFADSMSQLGW